MDIFEWPMWAVGVAIYVSGIAWIGLFLLWASEDEKKGTDLDS